MIDIISANNSGLGVYDSQSPRAANILSVQVQSLEYEQDLGIDLQYFLSEDFSFQNSAFKSYLIEVLVNRGINVTSVVEVIEKLYSNLTFNIKAQDATGGLVSR